MTPRRERADAPGAPLTASGVVGALALALLVAATANLLVGPVVIAPGEVLGAIARSVGLPLGTEPGAQAEAVILTIRLPRILVGAVAGAAAGISGAALQGLFRNPVADPHLLGIGPGASLGAALGSLSGTVAGAAAGGAVGGMLTALVVRRLGRRRGEASRFVLSGVALGAALSAWVGFVVFVADRTRVPPIDFWLLGSLAGANWEALGTLTMSAGIGVVGLLAAGRPLDLLSLGEADARRLGMEVELATFAILLAVGAVIGAAVGIAGVVVFVGLVAPHLVRRLAGAGHRTLLPGSALAGAVMMLLADLAARTVVAPQEIPVGLVTAAIGGPFFLWMIRHPAESRR